MATCKYKTSIGKKMMKLAKDVDRTVATATLSDEEVLKRLQNFVQILDEVERVFLEEIKRFVKGEKRERSI